MALSCRGPLGTGFFPDALCGPPWCWLVCPQLAGLAVVVGRSLVATLVEQLGNSYGAL